jgi:GntR family transcriptional repressor for pyruvate dehydrogenase complex
VARLHRAPLHTLIASIVSGRLAPGEALPREADLAERFDVSRATSREFLRGLEDRGLIAVKHGRGATVNPPELWDTLDPDVLASLLSGAQSAKVLRDFLETRRVFEVRAAELAAERADEHDVALLTDAFERMRAVAERLDEDPEGEREFHEADVAFHRTLVTLTRNSTMVALSSRIHAAMLEPRYPLAQPRQRASSTVPEHERILRAVARRSPSAAGRAMQAHLDAVGALLDEHEGERDPAG